MSKHTAYKIQICVRGNWITHHLITNKERAQKEAKKLLKQGHSALITEVEVGN